MEKWKEILDFCKSHENYVKIAVIVLVMITALVFFGPKGNNEEIAVITNGEQGEIVGESGGAGIETDETEKAVPMIVVDLSGAVKKPGVYEIPEGSRLYEVLEKAGGLLDTADTEAINQAELLYDGQKILISEKMDDVDGITSAGGGGLPTGVGADGRVNINVADTEALQQIPGVGPVTAEKILSYREANGRFSKIEDIKNVDGIGEKTFEKMKDMITV